MKRNIKLIYFFTASKMMIVIMPVIVPLFLSKGLTMQEVFTLQAIFAVTIAITEVPSGYLSDLIGRKKTLLFGSFIKALSWTCLAFADSFWGFVWFEFLIAIGLSCISGTDQALLYGTLEKMKADRGEFTKATGLYQQTITWGESFAAIVSFIALNWGMELVVKIQTVAGWLPFFAALLLQEIPYKKMDSKSHGKNFLLIMRRIFIKDNVLRLTVINQTLFGLSTFIIVWIYQKYWQDIGIELKYFALIWAAYNFIVGLTSRKVHYYEEKYGAILVLAVMGILPALSYLGVAATSAPFWVITIGFGFQISRGISQVLFRDAINHRLQDRYRATANSILSLLFRGGFIILGPFIGFLIDRFGIPVSLYFMAGLYGVVYLVSLMPLLIAIEKEQISKS